MDTNKLFSFQRIAMVMKRDFLENWKTNLYLFASLYAVFLFTYVLFMMSTPRISIEAYVDSYMGAFNLIFTVALAAGASMIMAVMKEREMRISYLMLPATMTEKFLARSVYATVGILVLLIVALMCAELTHLLIQPLFELTDAMNICVLPHVCERMIDIAEPMGKYTITYWDEELGKTVVETHSNLHITFYLIALALWHHSLFILGGNIWYKHPMVKTVVTYILVAGVLVYITLQIKADVEPWLERAFRREERKYIGASFFLLWTCFNWWLAYRLFTRSQVIKPKFRLL